MSQLLTEKDLAGIDVFGAHKQRLLKTLESAGITWVTVTFEGSGDSGAIEEVNYTWLDTVQDDTTRELARALKIDWYVSQGSRYDANQNSWVREWELCQKPLDTALEDFIYSLLERDFGGWVDNDGAYGTVEIDVLSKEINLEFNERYTTTNLHERTY
jgi:hypothetical protein